MVAGQRPVAGSLVKFGEFGTLGSDLNQILAGFAAVTVLTDHAVPKL